MSATKCDGLTYEIVLQVRLQNFQSTGSLAHFSKWLSECLINAESIWFSSFGLRELHRQVDYEVASSCNQPSDSE